MHRRLADEFQPGLFFVNMTATLSTSTVIPRILGTLNTNVRELGLANTCVKIHATLLAGSFLVLFH